MWIKNEKKMAILTRSRSKSGRWGLIVANYSPVELITFRTRPPSLSLPLPKSQKKPSSIPNLHILWETNAHFCFPNTPFKSGLRWSLENWGFFLCEPSIHFHGIYFFSWLDFEVSPFILAFSLLAGVPFSPWWMRKQLFAFNLSYAQLFILTWLVLWLDA